MKSAISFLFATIFLFSCDYNPLEHILKKRGNSPEIVGSWRLLYIKGEDPEGQFQYPFDMDTKGFASFDERYNFSFQYYDATRPRMKSDDPFFCSDPEIRIAYLSGQSLFGQYKLYRDSVGLHIAASLNPNISETTEKRYYKIHGDTLFIIASGRYLNGVFLKEHSVWIRADK